MKTPASFSFKHPYLTYLACGLLSVSLLTHCASTTSSTQGSERNKSTRSGGNSITVSGSYDSVWRAALNSTSKHLTVNSSSKSSGTIQASSGVGIATWGESVTIQITPPRSGAGSYTVRVNSRKRIPTQITGTNWTPVLLSEIQAAVR